MEIETKDGSKLALPRGSKTVFGRGSGFDTADRTVSRQHLLFETLSDADSSRASFQVLGKNPVWVRRGGDREIRVYRRSETGELAAGDWFCVAGQRPVWFSLKEVETESGDGSESELAETGDLTDIDPVKEFGFLVVGHEFDQYPKRMVREVKNWEWFLEEPSKGSDDEEEEPSKRRKRKRGKGHEEDYDEEWTGESEDEKDDLGKVSKFQKQKYQTRSRDQRKDKKSVQKRAAGSRNDDEEEEDDETLGGFIVKDNEIEPEEESGVEDENEEEFIDDEDEED